jgi:hypothetical protein
MKRVIRSDKLITSVFPIKSQKCDFGAEPRCRLFGASAGKGLNLFLPAVGSYCSNFSSRAKAGTYYYLLHFLFVER